MSADSLPYTVLILIAELAVGSLVFVTWFDARGMVTRGYVQTGAAIVVPSAVLALLIAYRLDPQAGIDGYTLRGGVVDGLRAALVLFTAVSVVHLVAAFTERARLARGLGAAGGVAGA